jgi:hypothetical protein
LGVDFVEKLTPTLVRGWDKGLDRMKTPHLFPVEPKAKQRTYRVAPDEGYAFQVGEDLFLSVRVGQIEVLRGRRRVGEVKRVAKSLLEPILAVGGIALCHVVKVYPQSGDADVTVD